MTLVWIVSRDMSTASRYSDESVAQNAGRGISGLSLALTEEYGDDAWNELQEFLALSKLVAFATDSKGVFGTIPADGWTSTYQYIDANGSVLLTNKSTGAELYRNVHLRSADVTSLWPVRAKEHASDPACHVGRKFLPAVRPRGKKAGMAWDAARQVKDWANNGFPTDLSDADLTFQVNAKMVIGTRGNRIVASQMTVKRALGLTV